MEKIKKTKITNILDKEQYYSFSSNEVIEKLGSNLKGLSFEESKKRIEKFGENTLPQKKKINPIFLFLKQFNSFLVYILIVAAGIAFYVDHMVDFYVIIVVVLFNSIMRFIQEYRAEKAVEALQSMISPHAKVYRDGKLNDVEAKELVPGDIIHLEAGDKIPADARIIKQSNLRTQEASLTGESVPISKNADTLPKNTSLADRRNMVWTGTFVADGQCDAIVVETGGSTAFGQIAESITSIKKEKSHFEKKANVLAKKVVALAILGAIATFFIGYYQVEAELADLFIFTLASLVSGIPEGLPAILSVVLAIGARRMASRNAIVKTLPAGETLGVADIIITDKTGTLTQNAMTVERVVLAESKDYYVSGNGWENVGKFFKDYVLKGQEVNPQEDKSLYKLLKIAGVCNSATVRKTEDDQKDKKGTGYKIIGDPTEAGISILAEKAGITKDSLEESGDSIIADFPFSQKLKFRSSILESSSGDREYFVVGAPEILINRSAFILKNGKPEALTNEIKEEIHEKINIMAKDALRVLGLAYREVSSETKEFSEDLAEDLIFVGLAGMKDPARPEVPEAIKKAHGAGVRVIMAAGDHKETAFAISKEIGLIDEDVDIENDGNIVMTGDEVEKMSMKDLRKATKEVKVFARLTPEAKLKIAEAFQKEGHIVAMTGDGVNDAPALKKADIGIAMGIMGTDVSREASKLILADDNFATIVNAIEEGRIIFGNVRQASTFLVTTNVAEDITIVSAMAMFHQFPLAATQILWLNLVTDGAAGIPLATEKAANKDVLNGPPKSSKEQIISGKAWPWLAIMGISMAVITLLVFNWFWDGTPDTIDRARTAAFTVMAFTQIFNMFNMRSLSRSVFSIGFFSNHYITLGFVISIILQVAVVYTPFFQNVFSLVPLEAVEFIALMLLSSTVLWIGEGYKALKKKMGWFQDY